MPRVVKPSPAAEPPANGLVRVRCMAEDFHLGDGRVLLWSDVAELPAELAAIGIERGSLRKVD